MGKLSCAWAVEWITRERKALTFGAQPIVNRISSDDRYGLADLEGYGNAGNAVKLYSGQAGLIWWCDPEGRSVSQHRFLVFQTEKGLRSCFLILFTQAVL